MFENNSEVSEAAGFTAHDSDFTSQGVRCAGTLYLPNNVERPPIVILGHGFAAVRAFRLAAFAARFAENGFAAYFFDYRCFGDSDGEPRHWVDPTRHQQDWRSALHHVTDMAEINPDKIILWGSSFSGGHVLQIASERPNIAAVIAQVPHVSGPATLKNFPLKNMLKTTVAAFKDALGTLLFNKPHYSPVIGRPGDYAVMTSEECWDGWFGMVPPESTWENKVLSRVFLKLAFFSPIYKVRRINVPALIVVGTEDTVTPPKAAESAAMRIPNAELKLFDCGHFSVYKGELFERNISAQLAFLSANFL